jgi:hypothetical protein
MREPQIESPVPDPDALGPGEDIEREPDGAPHAVIGWTAFTIVGIALILGALMAVGGAAALVTAIIVVVFGAPAAIVALRRAADSRRDQQHPSR